MLEIASGRLRDYPQISLHLQNVVTLSLPRAYDLAFSYGGVWYFVPDHDQGPGSGSLAMISHIRDEDENRLGFERIAASLAPGASLLLGIQDRHTNYSRPVADGLEYSQAITEIPDGFQKRYSLTDHGQTVMEQVTDYRTYSFTDAIDLLEKCGFEYEPSKNKNQSLFLELRKR
jgi:hypothetical protein